MMCNFVFEGKQYEVSADAYDGGYIRLPDGRLLNPGGWLESHPPIPTGLKIVAAANGDEVFDAVLV